MARFTFFSFHYERDIWRASQIRNSWVTKPDRNVAGFWDAASWEEAKKRGKEAIYKWIDTQMAGTSVTVVIIGYETSTREYIKYEIDQSIRQGKGLLGIHIHNMKDNEGKTDFKGLNPLPTKYSVYDWVVDKGYDNLGDWIERAAKVAG